MRLYYIDESEGPRFYVRTALGVDAERWNDLFHGVQEWRHELQDRYAVPADRELHACHHISVSGQALLAWNRTYETVCSHQTWVARLQSSSITTGSILIQQEGRSCPISPDPVHRIDMRNVGIVEWALKCSFPARINYRSSTLDVNGVQCQ